jgi:hypothetical protein
VIPLFKSIFFGPEMFLVSEYSGRLSKLSQFRFSISARDSASGMMSKDLERIEIKAAGRSLPRLWSALNLPKTRQLTSAGVEPARSIPVAERVCFPRRRSLSPKTIVKIKAKPFNICAEKREG